MSSIPARKPIAAILYNDGMEGSAVLSRVVTLMQAEGIECAGFIQHDVRCEGRARCDMILRNLMTGGQTQISEDRGAEARGCRLVVDQLLRVLEEVQASLVAKPDVLVINKFGKAESEGGGFRPLIADALDRDIPVLIAVPERNLEGWHAFAGPLAYEYPTALLSELDDIDVIATLTGGWRDDRVACSGLSLDEQHA